jgi:hypothetical protein
VRIVRKGYRVLFEASARAHDLMTTTPREDFTRKTRTIAGTFQLLARESWMLNPARSRIWFQALSHKALRLTIPALHALMLVANLALLDFWVFRVLLAGQALFYASALVGYLQIRWPRRHIVFAVPFAMCLLGWATIVGLGRFVARRQRVTWERMPGEPGPRVVSRPV